MENSLSCSRSQPRITSCSWAGVRNWTASSASVSRCQAERLYTTAHSLRPHSDPMAMAPSIETPHLKLTHASSCREQPVGINDTASTNTHIQKTKREKRQRLSVQPSPVSPNANVCSLKRSSLKIQKTIHYCINNYYQCYTIKKCSSHFSNSFQRRKEKKSLIIRRKEAMRK